MTKPHQPVEATSASGPGATEVAAEAALVKAPPAIAELGGIAVDSVASRIPIELDVPVPIRNFRVRNLLALEKGRVIESLWMQGEDLPLAAPGAQLAWSEFEVIDQKLAVRITRLV
jgi:flagellar motor switch/type III secretory pathway protein FliN